MWGPTEEKVKLEEGVDDLLQDTPVRTIHMISSAPMFIYENQVLPIGIHNLSKSFRPNLAMIRVYRLALYSSLKETMHKKINNIVYFTETKPGVFERNARFKLKSNFVANTQYKKLICSVGEYVKNKQSHR